MNKKYNINIEKFITKRELNLKSYVIWGKDSYYMYISNSIWIVKIPIDSVSSKITSILIQFFNRFPNENEVLVNSCGIIKEKDIKYVTDVIGKYDIYDTPNLKVTNTIYKLDSNKCVEIFIDDIGHNGYVVDTNYTNLINLDKVSIINSRLRGNICFIDTDNFIYLMLAGFHISNSESEEINKTFSELKDVRY